MLEAIHGFLHDKLALSAVFLLFSLIILRYRYLRFRFKGRDREFLLEAGGPVKDDKSPDRIHALVTTEAVDGGKVVNHIPALLKQPKALKYSGTITSQPIQKDDSWHFSLWNDKAKDARQCISNVRYRVQNQDRPFPAKMGDAVSVHVDHETHGIVFFEHLEILETS
jgi:hypothetical protein